MKKHSILNAPVLATLLATLLCCVGTTTEGQQKSAVPSGVLRKFPGYHLLTLKERDPDTKAFFFGHFPKSNPSVVQGDFDGDGQQDYALLLKSDKSPMTKLAVLLCSDDEHCQNVYELDVTMYSDLTFIRPATLARSELAVIQLTYFEKGKILLSWNAKAKKMQEVQTAD
jgi:hypothetical protein